MKLCEDILVYIVSLCEVKIMINFILINKFTYNFFIYNKNYIGILALKKLGYTKFINTIKIYFDILLKISYYTYKNTDNNNNKVLSLVGGIGISILSESRCINYIEKDAILLLGAYYNNLNLVKFININYNFIHKYNYTALTVGASRGNIKIVKYIHENCINIYNNKYISIYKIKYDVLSLINNVTVHNNNYDFKTYYYNNAMFYSIENGFLDIIEYLIKGCIDLHIKIDYNKLLNLSKKYIKIHDFLIKIYKDINKELLQIDSDVNINRFNLDSNYYSSNLLIGRNFYKKN